MKPGDLVKVVRSKVKGYGNLSVEPIGVGKVGVIIESRDLFSNQDGFVVMTGDKMIVLGSNYLEVINEAR
jgi:hypothetical protein